MNKRDRLAMIFAAVAFALAAWFGAASALAASASELELEARKALANLYASSPAAKALGEKAAGILVFPGIVKGGFIVGGHFGEGALLKGDRVVAFYNSIAASYGLQAGLQKFGYALFFMTESALKYIDESDGWEIGVGPNIVVVDVGAATAMTTTTLQSDIYAVFFDQKGLMAGLGLQGAKITRLDK